MTSITTMPTAEQISAMPSGPELDALVHHALGQDGTVRVHCGGCDGHDEMWPSNVSSDGDEAMRALETWREQHPEWSGRIDLPDADYRYRAPGAEGYRVSLWRVFPDGIPAEPVKAEAPTLALAISRAIAMVEEVQDEETC